MKVLSSSTLLSVWERGLVQRPPELAITLLTAALPELAPDALAQASVGRRDGWLLDLRERLFGSRLNCVASCPRCAERLEIAFDSSDIRRPADAACNAAYTHMVDEFQIEFRLPDSGDLTEIAPLGDESAGRTALIERCILRATENGVEVPVTALPDSVVSAVIEHIGDLDPQADVSIELNCPYCGECWQAVFDIVSFFWKEIGAWAARILRDVHTLASAYGWREADILAMSSARRQIYLTLVS